MSFIDHLLSGMHLVRGLHIHWARKTMDKNLGTIATVEHQKCTVKALHWFFLLFGSEACKICHNLTGFTNHRWGSWSSSTYRSDRLRVLVCLDLEGSQHHMLRFTAPHVIRIRETYTVQSCEKHEYIYIHFYLHMDCSVLFCIVLYCIVLYCIVLYCIISFCFVI